MNKRYLFLILVSSWISLFAMNRPLLIELRKFENEFHAETCRGIINKCRWFASGIIGVPSAATVITGEGEQKIAGLVGLTVAAGIWFTGQAMISCMNEEEKLEKIYSLIEKENNSTILQGALEIVTDIQNRRVRKTRWFIFDLNFLFLYYLLRCDHSSTEKDLGLIRAALIMRLNELI